MTCSMLAGTCDESSSGDSILCSLSQNFSSVYRLIAHTATANDSFIKPARSKALATIQVTAERTMHVAEARTVLDCDVWWQCQAGSVTGMSSKVPKPGAKCAKIST